MDAVDTYTLTATAPNFTPATSGSFDVSGEVLGCDAGGGDAYPTQSGDAADSVDLVRETGACDEDIPVTIVVRENEVEVQKPPVEGAAFTMTIVWTVETPQNPVPATQIDYLDGFGPHDMQFCLADGPDADTYPDLPPRNDLAPGNEFWCITNQQADVLLTGPNAGLLQVTEDYFGSGDPRFTR